MDREFQKNSYFCFIDYARAFDCVDHNILWKVLKEMTIPDYLTCLLRNLYVGQKATELQEKNIYFCFIGYAKAFACVDYNKLWKILKGMRIHDHLTCLLRNLYVGQEATIITGYGTTN